MNKSTLDDFQKHLEEYRHEEESRLIEYLGKKYGFPVLHIGSVELDTGALQLVKEKDARAAKMAAYKLIRKKVSVAINEPGNPALKDTLHMLEKRGYSYEISMAPLHVLERMWEGYKEVVATSVSKPGVLTITNEDLEEVLDNMQSLGDVRKFFEKIKNMSRARKLSKSIEYIVACAIATNTSDIHVEPDGGGGVVRYRIDGVLTDVMNMPATEYNQLMTRMRLISGMKLTSKKIAQDGGFVIDIADRTISIRSSLIPEDKGGSFVLRILDPKNIISDIEKLGLHPVLLEIFKKNITKPNGMILTTGPTGSGKTTTLYSLLSTVKNPGTKIITIEDPVEYRLDGIVQSQISKNYTFSSGLRSVLRQDPDIIMVGEIRDSEVAEIAVQASLTGHLVLSTLHTNDALGALPRLEQFEIDSKDLSRALNIVIAQRLARVLCPHCSEKHILTDAQKEVIHQMIQEFPSGYRDSNLSTDNIRKPGEGAGTCEHCANGYKGRVGIFEVFEINEDIIKTYTGSSGISAMFEEVKKQGLPFMKDDGLWKVLQGKTSLEEIQRTIGVSI